MYAIFFVCIRGMSRKENPTAVLEFTLKRGPHEGLLINSGGGWEAGGICPGRQQRGTLKGNAVSFGDTKYAKFCEIC